MYGIEAGSEVGDELSFERKSTWMGTCDKMKMCLPSGLVETWNNCPKNIQSLSQFWVVNHGFHLL